MRFLIVSLLLISTSSFAQDEDGQKVPGRYTGEPKAVGDVAGSSPVTFNTGVLAIEHDGNGNLFYTSTLDDEVGLMDTTGNQIQVLFTANQGKSGSNPLGITGFAGNLFITDSLDDEVEIYSMAGAPLGVFSVVGQTPFPEGITYSPRRNSFFVVDGAFASDPPDSILEYATDGSFINQTVIPTLSNDGAAYDAQRCSVWVYESGGDSVTQYAEDNMAIVTTFAGTATAGFGGGEGVAVIGNTLYIMATATDTLVAFDISAAPGACPIVPVPSLSKYARVLLITLLLLLSIVIYRRRLAL